MLVLAVDTATPAVTAGVVRLGDRPEALAVRVTVDPRAHAELLNSHVVEVLAETGLSFAELDAVVAGVGPGPFTGLRVGVVTAAAYGHAAALPVYPVCTLDAIAAEAPHPVLVATDARRREVYWARYDSEGHRVEGPHVQRPAEVDTAGVPRAAGYGARLYADALGLPVVGPEYPSPTGLVAAGAPALRAVAEPAPLVPLYLRRPDAQQPGARKRVLPA